MLFYTEITSALFRICDCQIQDSEEGFDFLTRDELVQCDPIHSIFATVDVPIDRL